MITRYGYEIVNKTANEIIKNANIAISTRLPINPHQLLLYVTALNICPQYSPGGRRCQYFRRFPALL